MTFQVTARAHPRRLEIEALIRSVYSREYDATVTDFPEALAVLFDANGDINCAAGLRFGGFFSENYLDAPIERYLGAAIDQPVARETIVEVATLAGRLPGSALHLIDHIVRYCRDQGCEWAFFTATRRLRVFLRRAGLDFLDLAPADASRVASPEQWGTYYRSAPRVIAVRSDWVTRDFAAHEARELLRIA